MLPTAARSRKAWLIAALLCALLFVQAASLSAEYSHKHSQGEYCNLCQFAPMPALQIAATFTLAPTLAVAWSVFDRAPGRFSDPHFGLGASRAPPPDSRS